ncbi:MAG: ABC transporter ATP-binding protein [Gammaproteobacteria bacterium]|nr:ABC transporter ATP-binding protein [Gammaproteobacteria bacterium]
MKSTETKLLLDIVRPYKWYVVLLAVCMLLASVFDSISVGLTVPLLASLQMMESPEDMPSVLAWLFGILMRFPADFRILTGIIAVVIALIFKNVMLAFTTRLSLWLSTRVSVSLSIQAVDMLLQTGIDYHHKNRVGEQMVTCLKAPMVVSHLVNTIAMGLSNLVTAFLLLVLMLIISWQLTLISVFFGVLYFVLTTRYLKTLEEPSRALARVDLSTHSTMQETLNGIELIKSYGKESWMLGKLSYLIRKGYKLRFRNSFRSEVVGWVTDVAGGIVIALLFFIGMFIYDFEAPVLLVILIPFLYIVIRLVPLLGILNHNKAEIIIHWPMLGLISALLDPTDKTFIKDGDVEFSGLKRKIRFRDVAFTYDNKELPALDQLNFSIPEGKVTAIVGRSGAGKTTLVHLLLRYFDPGEGAILLDDIPLPCLQLHSYLTRISIVSQQTVIFDDTVRKNIAFGMQVPPDEVLHEVARKAGAWEFISQLESGFDTMLGERGVRLSGGQRQRISIARAFLKNPEILVLDEATSSLDSLTEEEIYKHLESLKSNRTVIVISHRLSTIKGADQIIVLKDGRIVEKGNARDLLALGGEYHSLSLRQEMS